MKLTGWKDIVELLGIAGIIGSLLFVGYQLKQTRDSLNMQFAFGETLVFQELQSRINQNADLAKAWVISSSNPSELTPEQKVQLTAWFDEWFFSLQIYMFFRSRDILTTERIRERMVDHCRIYTEHRSLIDELRQERNIPSVRLIDEFCIDSAE